MSEYRFERLSDTNLKDLLFLYKHAFNENESFDFLKKKYDTSCFGLKNIGFIAYSNKNEPAAYYGVFPVKAQFNGKEILVAQSGDTMTHPNHRGKGLFITLAKKTYDLAKESGVEFIFGFPNDNSYPGFVNKLGWNHYSNINNYKLLTKSLPFEKVAKKFSFFNSYYKLFVNHKLKNYLTDTAFDNSLGLQSQEYGFVLHNTYYFNYKKYYQSYVVKLNGVKCWIKIDGRMWVGDIEFCSETKFKETVSNLMRLAEKLMCSSVYFSVQEKSLYDKYLEVFAKPNSKNSVGCLNLKENANGEKFAYQSADFDTF